MVTLNRPKRLNAINHQMLGELKVMLASARGDKQVRGIIITGTEGVFSAGADITEFQGLTAEEAQRLARFANDVFLTIEHFPKPVIAAINGKALGGGAELAMACHMRIASFSASFAQPEVKLGLIPGYGATVRLPKLVGKGCALELLLTGEIITSMEALRIGLVNHVVTDGELLHVCLKLMQRIIRNSPSAITSIISSVNAPPGSDSYPFKTETEEFAKCFNSGDFKEGLSAFFQKRMPTFKGN